MPSTKRTEKAAASIALRRTATKPSSQKPRLQHIAWDSIPLERLNPLLDRQFIVGKNIMISRVLLKKGSVVPKH